MNADDGLWDIDEVAQYLKVTKDTVYRWIDKKQKLGKNGCLDAMILMSG